MKRFLIEREIPGASELTERQLAEISRTSNAAAASLQVPYTWVTSYVAGDRMYCVHEANDEEAVREHGPGGRRALRDRRLVPASSHRGCY